MEKQLKTGKALNQDLSKVLLASRVLDPRERRYQLQRLANNKGPVGKNQCAYCKEEGHWLRDYPKRRPRPQTKVLALEED